MNNDILINFDQKLKKDFEKGFESNNYKEIFNVGKTYCQLSTVNNLKKDYFLENAKDCFEYLKDKEIEEIPYLQNTMYYIYDQACKGIYNYEEKTIQIEEDNEFLFCSNKIRFNNLMDEYDNLKNKNNILKELLDYFDENSLEFTEEECSKIFNWFEGRMTDNLIIKYYIGNFYLEGRGVKKNKEKGIKLIKETEDSEDKNIKFTENLILLGNWYRDGMYVDKDINKAGELYSKALSISNDYDDSVDKLTELIKNYDWWNKDQYNNLLQILNNNISDNKSSNEEYKLLKKLINNKIK
jgi:hypothetical protein